MGLPRSGRAGPEPKVQVGEVSNTLGSSNARRCTLIRDVPSPSSKEHRFKELIPAPGSKLEAL
jgi:hypothetical protein